MKKFNSRARGREFLTVVSLNRLRLLYEHVGLRRVPDEYLVRRGEQSLRLDARPDAGLGGELPGRELHAAVLARRRAGRACCVLQCDKAIFGQCLYGYGLDSN